MLTSLPADWSRCWIVEWTDRRAAANCIRVVCIMLNLHKTLYLLLRISSKEPDSSRELHYNVLQKMMKLKWISNETLWIDIRLLRIHLSADDYPLIPYDIHIIIFNESFKASDICFILIETNFVYLHYVTGFWYPQKVYQFFHRSSLPHP